MSVCVCMCMLAHLDVLSKCKHLCNTQHQTHTLAHADQKQKSSLGSKKQTIKKTQLESHNRDTQQFANGIKPKRRLLRLINILCDSLTTLNFPPVVLLMLGCRLEGTAGLGAKQFDDGSIEQRQLFLVLFTFP